MGRARIVTDSSADLSDEIVHELGITVVPLRIKAGAETLADGPMLRSPEFYRRVAKGKATPMALAVTTAEFSETYQRLAQETDEIVSIHLGAQLSNTVNAANQARMAFWGRCQINVMASRSPAMTTTGAFWALALSSL